MHGVEAILTDGKSRIATLALRDPVLYGVLGHMCNKSSPVVMNVITLGSLSLFGPHIVQDGVVSQDQLKPYGAHVI